MIDFIVAPARRPCFDGPDGADDTTPKFSQEDLDRVLAEDRRKHQQTVVKIQSTLEETLNSKNLTAQERDQLAQRLEEAQRANETAAQTAAREKKQAEEAAKKDVAEAEKTAKTWQEKFKQQLIESRLNEAVSDPDLFQPSQVKMLLKGAGVELQQVRDDKGQMTDQFEVVVNNFEDRTEAGEPCITHGLSPVAAVKRMKVLKDVYGNMVRSSIVSGVGSGSGAGVATGQGIDPARLSTEQYMTLRSTAQGRRQLGLRADPRKHK